MSLYSIKHRSNGSILFEMECSSLRLCVGEAVMVGANLTHADLSGANLAWANLARANLERADLTGATLTSADLTGADLERADLVGVNLLYASLAGANLAGASLAYANLTHANLVRADLTSADLTGADLLNANLARADLIDTNLTRANLTNTYLVNANFAGADFANADLSGTSLARADFTYAKIAGAKNLPSKVLRAVRADFFDVLLRAIPEVPALLRALHEGRIDGGTYKSCLWGTIANIRGVDVHSLRSISDERLAERWFHAINSGDTPATNAAARQVEAWIVEFMKLVNPERNPHITTQPTPSPRGEP